MADYTYPKLTIMGKVYDVSKMFQAEGMGNYTSSQGYTVTTEKEYKHFITAIDTNPKSNTKDKVAVGLVKGKQGANGKVDGKYKDDKSYGHANDCTYYDNCFFIAQGGGKNKPSLQILCLNSSLEEEPPYYFQSMTNCSNGTAALTSITGISHIKYGYFALGQEDRISICELHKDTRILKEISRFELSKIGTHLSRKGYTRVGQGIYCTGSKLYKAFSYEIADEESNEAIKRNDIGVFKFNSGTPSMINRATFSTSYSCDHTEKKLFEIESLGSPDDGKTMFMLTNVDENGQKDTLYKVSFS